MSMGIDRSAYMGAFREEMLEHLQQVTQGLLSLESHPEDGSVVGELFRRVHTIKGSARMMGFTEMADLAHSMEDVLDQMRSGRLRAGAPLLDAMLSAVDLLRELAKNPSPGDGDRPDVQAVLRWLADLGGGSANVAEGPAPTLPDQPPAPVRAERIDAGSRDTVRVGVGRIDTILNLAGELMVLEAARKQWLEDLSQWTQMLDTAGAVARNAGLKGLSDQAQQLSSDAARAAKRYRRLFVQQAELVRELHYQVSTLRMLPTRSIFSTLPRAARDLAKEEGKEVEVVTQGEDTEVDREVLERVRDPLLHLLSNAIHHGIEIPSDRAAAGKPRVGRVRITAYSRGEQAVIEVEDDGAGVDFPAVRQAAVGLGMLGTADAEQLDDSESARLLFLPGLTTSRVVSGAAGRGVGLDVVKSELDALKGRVFLETRKGEGTKVGLEFPITMAFTHVLLVEIGQSIYGIPCSSTQGIAEVPTKVVLRTLRGREALDMTGRAVPLVWTHRLLGVEPAHAAEMARWPALLLGPAERPMAFAVDRVIGDENVIVKPLSPLLRRLPNVSGGIILGDGRVALLLSATALMDAAIGHQTSPPVTPPSRKARAKALRLLVVDDAAISRELERGILSAAGYEVETAVDGVDALEKLKSGDYALVVADVDMPRMNGLELTATIRADPSMAELPVVIVSARESDEDRRRGMEVGAQAYVGKGSFDQTTLLDAIESLIG